MTALDPDPGTATLAPEHRDDDRVLVLRRLRLHGKNNSFGGVLLDVSRSGALVAIVDENWEGRPQDDDMGMVGLRIASNFGDGLRIEFEDTETSIEAEVVRIADGALGPLGVTELGVHFLREPTEDELAAVGLRPLIDPESAANRAALEALSGAPGTALSPGAHIPQVVVVQGADLKGAKEPVSRIPAQVRINEGGAPIGLSDLLQMAVDRNASDLHIKATSPARMRADGKLVKLGDRQLTTKEVESLIRELLTNEQMERFETDNDLDLAHSLPGAARFRINVLRSRGEPGLAIRRIPEIVPSAEELGISKICLEVAERPRGLVLVTGPTGSGKSTTLAAMIQHVNRSRNCHIVTMEDPIEYIHREDRAHITQREIGRDTKDFTSALRRALRQDPDVILVGEMRDLETISLAVTAAETGHLVFATLHTTSAVLTVDRVVDVFPPAQQRQIRMQLADALQAIFSQTLMPRLGRGVAIAQEILVATGGIRALIREGKTPQIGNMMQTGASVGMQTLEDALNDLVARRQITFETAVAKANHPAQIKADGKLLGH